MNIIKPILIVSLFLGLTVILCIVLLNKSQDVNNKDLETQKHYAPTQSSASFANQGFSSWSEAVSGYSKKPSQENIAKLRSVVLTGNDLKTLAEKLKPVPADTKLSPEVATERRTLIQMLAYCSPDEAMSILAPLTNANNQTLERCSAICSIGNLGTDAAFEYIKLINTGDNPQVIIAVATGLERNGSPKIVPLYIDFLEKAVNQPAEKRQMTVGLISSRLPNITGANPLPKFNPIKGDPQELAKAWKDWWEKQPSDFKTTIQKQREAKRKNL